MRHRKRNLLGLATALAFAFLAPSAQADSLIKFTFENFSLGQISGPASSAGTGLSATHSMANNGVENFGAPNNRLSMTRFAGSVNFPELTFATTIPIYLSEIAFLHIHNHNPGFPSYPDYQVDLDLDTGSGYATLDTFLAAPAPGGYIAQNIAGPGLLLPGTYKVRWVPQVSPDTNTEFFGLDNIELTGTPLGCDPCATWKNHGAYVSCVAHTVNSAVASGDVPADQVQGLVALAAQSDIGKQGFVPAECPVSP